jgi:predicted MFS family arabinose efflux permease
MTNEAQETIIREKLLIPALVLAVFLVNTFTYSLTVMLLDVAKSFSVSVGTASQLFFVSRLFGLITGYVLSTLALRYKLKSLLLSGILIYGIGLLGSALSPNFISMLIFQTLLGTGGSAVIILVFVLIGVDFQLEKRGWVMGLMYSTYFAAGVIVNATSGFFIQAFGWRPLILCIFFPLSIATLFFSFLVIRVKPFLGEVTQKHEFRRAFKQILSNKSIIGCLLAGMLLFSFAVTFYYTPSFLRTQFSMSVAEAGSIAATIAIIGVFGSLIAGRLINRAGRRPVAIWMAVVGGISNLVLVLMPNIFSSLAALCVSMLSLSMVETAFSSLVLEQNPTYRGTVMSINVSFRYFGIFIGLSLGGLVLNTFANNYQLLLGMFGVLAILSASFLMTLTKDPTRDKRC